MLLHPKHFGPGLRDVIRRKLHDEVESTCVGQYVGTDARLSNEQLLC